MRIGLDAKRAFHNSTGLGNYSRSLIDGISEFYPDEEIVLYNPKTTDREWGANYSTIYPKGSWGFLPSSLWRTFGITKTSSFHLLDIYHGLSHELPIGIEKFSCKKIVTIHDLIFMKGVEHFPLIDKISYRKKIDYALSVADVILAISEQSKRDLIELLKVDPKKIEVHYQSCHSDYLNNYSKNKDNYLLFVGSFRERKNVLNIIRAFSHVQKEFPQLKLKLAGGGSDQYVKQMKDLITTFSLDDFVEIIYSPEFEQLKKLYKHAKIFLFPSFYEGFGIPIIESLFSGTPVVAATGSCLEEAGGPGARYCEPSSVESIVHNCLEILSDSDLYKSLVEKGFNHVQQFSLENSTKKLMEIYLK